MKNYILYILFTTTLNCFANEYCINSLNNGKLHMTWASGCGLHQFETRPKGEIFLELAAALLKEKNYTKQHIFISYSSEFFRNKATYIKIKYDKATYSIYNNNTSKEYTEKGIIFEIHQHDFDIKQTLNLINHAIDSITNNKTDTAIVNKILQQRIYRNKTKITDTYQLDYYFENSKFYFYYLDRADYPNTAKTLQKNLLVTNNVFEIVGQNQSEGYFVFVNDSLFYFLRHTDVSKPLLFKWRLPKDSVFPDRSPISKYDVEYHDEERSFLQRFYLHYNYEDRKALFIPHLNFVEPNYYTLESQFIKSLTNPTFITKPNEQVKSNKLYYIILIIFLAISVLLNFIYIRKNK